ncbi:MAG: hypothetical protein NVSMB15_00530 [Steroidobacteraceae bacterium]
MRSNFYQSFLSKSGIAASVLLLSSAAAFAQQQVNLTAAATTAAMPDGASVPMWGYSCGAAVTGSTATCAALNAAAGLNWSPVVITVPTGQDLQINLTNKLPGVPTSLTIVGQLGGGLGTSGTKAPGPPHAPQGVTWSTANTGANFNPPPQPSRVQSFASEVATGATSSLCWGPSCTPASPALKPGTYLIESGTHPSIQGPMGLYGILVVTSAPSGNAPGIAYGSGATAVNYNADIPLLLSEIDPAQNAAVSLAVGTAGFQENSTQVMQDTLNTVIIAQGGMNYSTSDTVTLSGGACKVAPAATVSIAKVDPATKAITLLNVNVTNAGSGCSSAPTVTVTSASGSGASLLASMSVSAFVCSGGASACYPPAVNYTPLYYLFNGVAFDKTHAASSVFAASPGTATAPVTGNVLVRLVNAGLRMHVPAIVGALTGASAAPVSGFSLVAEDGNPVPGTPRVQSEVFMAAGKTYDVMILAPAAATPSAPALPI